MRRAQPIGRLADDVKGVPAACEQSNNIGFIQGLTLDRSPHDRIDLIVD